ncbi:SDR family NAD(P)-dependent oxidoreductase [Aquipuribacter sp. MA13-6]|uniref:SDR family NAD(P)-dependent oxidoreductase n=1 Tax=unclassified Aquipuribacter TaxID=2635084 RepID=UPI003EEF4BB3
MPPFTFADRVCLLTGAASGIGAALAHDLASRGARLALVDQDADGLAATARAARLGGSPDVSTHLVDLAAGGDLTDLARAVVDRHGRIDLLVNNAGVALGGRVDQVSVADVDRLLAVNLHAVVALTIACLPSMPAGSHLVFVSSVFGLAAPPGQAAYAASKFGVRGFAEALRHELRDAGTGVTVVHPGGVRTSIARSARMGDGVPVDQAAAGLAEMDRLLRMPPHRAARLVLRAVQRRRGRVLVGAESYVLDVLVRLAPQRYWSVVDRVTRSRFDGRW